MIKKFNVEKTKQLWIINKFLSKLYTKPICSKNIELEAVKEILVIDFALMGDMIMNIPFLKTIKQNCPNARITMVGMPWSETILGDQDLIDEFVIFDGKNKLISPRKIMENRKEIKRILRKINKKSYQFGFEPKGDLRHILFLHYTRCDRTISYNYTGGEYLITDSFTPKVDTRHLIDEKLDLLKMSGFRIFDEDRIPELKLSQESKDLINDFRERYNLEEKRIIGIHPGASNINKQYRYYPELVKKLMTILRKEDIFCVFEGPGEEKIVDSVCKQLEEMSAEYIRIKRKTKEYVALVSICDYMICNDSAAGHIAAAYGIPSFIIFGPVKPENALPKGKCQINYVSLDIKCKPCTMPTCPRETEDCIKKISLNDVFNRLKLSL